MILIRVILVPVFLIFLFTSVPAQKRSRATAPIIPEMVSEWLPTREEENAAVTDLPRTPGDEDSLITVSSYPMTVLGGWPFENMSGGTTQLIGPGTDNDNSVLSPIGFTFRYDNNNFTTFGVNGNGFVTFGFAPTTGSPVNNTMSNPDNSPRVMPFWDNLCVGTNGKVHYRTSGVAGNRKLIVEWQNMQITRNGACSGPGGGTFQLWLLETTGVIQFVYGDGMTPAAADNGYSIGLQSLSPSNFASVTTASNTVSYVTANDSQTTPIPPGTSYVFVPNVPPPPSFGSVTAVTQTSLQLNWTDNASTETVYQVSRSTDNVNFTVVANPPANSATFADSGLTPATQYFYRVNALSEGAFSQDLSLSATTNASGSISSTSTGGMWSSPGTWSGGSVPAAGDHVTILDGATVTIDTAAVALSLTVGSTGALSESDDKNLGSGSATLTFEETAPHSLAVGTNVLIKSNGVFATPGLGNVTGHALSVGGNLTNNGGLDLSTNNNQAGAALTFTGASSNTFGGTGPVTDVRTITVNKGTVRENILELNPANFTVQGSTGESPGSGFLTITNGTFKISGTFTGGHRTFATAAYSIPNSGGIWLNNPNYTIAGQNGSANVFGTFRITTGTYNAGTATGDSIGFGTNSTVTIEGGAVNTTGRFGVSAASNVIGYTQTAGTVITCTIGHTSSTAACFDMGSAGGSAVTITGGEIVIQNRGTAASGPRDYRHQAGTTGTATVTGGTVWFGNASTTGAGTYIAVGAFPNVVIDNTAGGHTVSLQSPGGLNNITRNVTVNPGTTFNINNNPYLMNGSTFINNGTLASSLSTSNFVWFDPTGNPTYSGSGVATGILGNFTVQGQSVTLAGSNNIRVRNLTVFSGNIINANKLTLGNNDSTVNAVQFGNPTTPTPAGTLDSAPVFNLGTGGQTLRYLRTGNIRTAGPEVNPTGNLVSLTYDNDDPATDELNVPTDLTVSGTLFLTNGEIKLGAGKTITHNGTATRVNGYVNGTLKRTYTAQQSHYIYHVGANGYSPAFFFMGFLDINPSTISVKPVDSVLPDLNPAISGTRYWEVVKTGNVLGRWEFMYTDADVVGDETTYSVWGQHGTARSELEGQSNNPATNTLVSVQPLSDIAGKWGFGHFAQPRTLSGTVYTFTLQPIRNAYVQLSGPHIQTRVTQTGSLGNFAFDDVLTGTTYTLFVSQKRFRFSPISRDVLITGDHNPPINVIANENTGFLFEKEQD